MAREPKLTHDDWSRLKRIGHSAFRIYQPTSFRPRGWEALIDAGYMTVTDANYHQETVLICEITPAGRKALVEAGERNG